MDPTTSTTTPPAAGPSKRQRKAALPLGDLTNLLPSTPAPGNPRTRRPLPPLPSSCFFVSEASPAAAVDEPSSVKSPISTVYTSRKAQRRRRRNPTGVKAPFPAGTVASCCRASSSSSSSHSTRKTSVAQGTRPISSSAPCHRAKKKQQTRMGNLSSVKPMLPEDFVEKQRAYFQEIDAFELPEEEASEIDLE